MRRARCAWLLVLLAALACKTQAAGFVEVAVRAGKQTVQGTVTIANVNGGESAKGALADGRFQAELPAGRYQITVKATQPSGQRETPPFDLADGEARAFYLRLNGR